MKININKISLLYLLVSLFIFLCTWLNLPFAVISTFGLLLIVYFILKENNKKEFFSISINYFIIVIIIAALWAFLAGIGGYFWQCEPDWPFRNAMIRDLANFSWPVYYSDENALTYYFGFYLPPMFLAKLTSLCQSIFLQEKHTTLAFFNFFSFCWATFGIVLCFLQLFSIVPPQKKCNYIWIPIIFIFFSSLDLFIGNRPHSAWHPPFSYLNNTYQLFFSYHIAIPIWLSTFVFFNKLKEIEYYGLFSILFLFYCPVTLYCTGLFFIYYALQDFIISIKYNKVLIFFKKLLNIKNILSLFVLFPIIYLFYKSNYTASNYTFYLHKCCKLVIECILYGVLIYLILCAKIFYKTSLFYLTTIILVLFPFIAFRTDYDFMMRATIPAIIILMTFVIKFLFIAKESVNLYKNMLIIMVLIGAISPIEMIVTAYNGWNYRVFPLVKDRIITLKDKIILEPQDTDQIYDYKNYVSVNYKKYIFWKYIAKPKSKEKI